MFPVNKTAIHLCICIDHLVEHFVMRYWINFNIACPKFIFLFIFFKHQITFYV